MKRYPTKTGVILPPTRDPAKTPSVEVQRIPDRSIVLEDALQVLWVEISRMKQKQARRMEALDVKDIGTLNKLVDSLSKIAKEQREQAKGNEVPEGMTEEEYLAVLEEAADAMREKIKAKQLSQGGQRNEGQGNSE